MSNRGLAAGERRHIDPDATSRAVRDPRAFSRGNPLRSRLSARLRASVACSRALPANSSAQNSERHSEESPDADRLVSCEAQRHHWHALGDRSAAARPVTLSHTCRMKASRCGRSSRNTRWKIFAPSPVASQRFQARTEPATDDSRCHRPDQASRNSARTAGEGSCSCGCAIGRDTLPHGSLLKAASGRNQW